MRGPNVQEEHSAAAESHTSNNHPPAPLNVMDAQSTPSTQLTITAGELLPAPTNPNMFRKIYEDVLVTRFKFCGNLETVARLIRINPAIFSLCFGISPIALLDEFLKMWPGSRKDVLPYLVIPAAFTGSIGWLIGAHAVLNPKRDLQSSAFKRLCVATLEGFGAVVPFVLGEEIIVYCRNSKHLNDAGLCTVSDKTFWADFFPAPVLLGTAYVAWNMLPLSQKLMWMSQHKGKKILIVSIDSLSSLLLYSRVFQTLLMNIASIPQPLIYEVGAISAGVSVLLMQTLVPKHAQKLNTVIMYAMALHWTFYLANLLAHEETINDWSPVFTLTVFPLLFLSGLAFTLWHSSGYIHEWKTVETYVEAGHPQLLLNQHMNEALLTKTGRKQIIDQLLAADPEFRREFLNGLFESTPLPNKFRTRFEVESERARRDSLPSHPNVPNSSSTSDQLHLSLIRSDSAPIPITPMLHAYHQQNTISRVANSDSSDSDKDEEVPISNRQLLFPLTR